MAQTDILGLLESDFTDNALLDLGTDVTLIKRIKTIDNITGSPTYTEQAPIIIQGVFTKRGLRFNWNKEGMTEMGDAYVMVPFSTNITRNDFIEFDNQRYRVETVLERIPGGIGMFKSVVLFKVEDV